MNDFLTPFIAVIAIAAVLGMIMNVLRQPLLIGYILTGLIVGPLGLSLVTHAEPFELFSSLGVSFLLFLVGLGINPRYIRDVGAVAVITGIAQIVFTTVLGVLIALALGFSLVPALYISVAFAFSSTIIVLRLLQDAGEEDTLFGRISIGFLLVQDLAAMAIFLVLSANSAAQSWTEFSLILLLKIGLIIGCSAAFIRFVLPWLDRIVGKNRELMLMMSLALCLFTAWLFSWGGFSLELGALTAGVLLSFSASFREIGTRIQPLRDFFLVLFFVMVGAQIQVADIQGILPAVAIFSVFILVGNPLIVYTIMSAMGYTRKTAFFSGLTVAQISEFSLILIAVGISLGHVTNEVLALATFVGLITMAASSYLMTFKHEVYRFLAPVFIALTPWREKKRDDGQEHHPFELLLFGAHRLGGGLLREAQEMNCSYLVVDFDPHLVSQLQQEQVVARFGSADDPVFLDALDLSRLQLVISTLPDHETNQFLVEYMRKRVPSVTIVCVSHHAEEARELYDSGADYVVMPPYLGRRFMVDLFKKNQFQHNKYSREKARHMKDLVYLS